MTMLTDVQDWTSGTPCYDRQEAWYPEHSGSQSASSTKFAIAACRTQCGVRRQCAQLAVKKNEQFGIWGGFNLSNRGGREDIRMWLGGAPATARRTVVTRLVNVG